MAEVLDVFAKGFSLIEAEENLHKALEDWWLKPEIPDGLINVYKVWKVDGKILLIKDINDQA